MNEEELLAANALFVQGGMAPYWSVIMVLSTFLNQQAAKLFQQHRQHLTGNYGLNSAFEKDHRLLRTKAYWQSISLYCATYIISQLVYCIDIYRKEYVIFNY
jgi:hypothetical protein